LTEFEQLSEIAPILDSLSTRTDAGCSYETMSDALVWGDEIPEEAHLNPEKFWVLRFLFRYRTSIILGRPDSRYESLWKLAQEACPRWPGLSEDRRQASLESLYQEQKTARFY
jgi:hypothetical protein